MKLSHNVINLVVFLLRFAIFCFLVKLIGIIKGIILSLILFKFYHMLLFKIFSLEPFSGTDLNFVAWEPEKQYNLIFALILNGKKKEEVKSLFIERCVKFFKRLRQKMVFRIDNYYWQEFSEDEAIKQIFLTEKKLNTEEEIIAYGEELIKTPFRENEFQWKVFISENDNGQTVFIIQKDHSIADGMGLMCLISKFTDDFNINNFPKIKKKTLLQKIKMKILSPFYSVYVLYRLFLSRSGNGPFKCYKKYSLEKNTIISKRYDFTEINKVCKKIGATFNDYIISIINSASKKYCKENGLVEQKKLFCLIPINLRDMPTTLEEFSLTNQSSGAGICMELIDDPLNDCSKIQKHTEYDVKHHQFAETCLILNTLTNCHLPFWLNRHVNKGSAKHYDFVLSNVSGPPKPFKIAGCEVIDFVGLPNPGPHSCFIAVMTYMGKVRVYFMKNKSVECDEKKFMAYIEKEIEQTLNYIKVD